MFFFFITSFRSPSGELVAKNTPSRGATEFGRMYSILASTVKHSRAVYPSRGVSK